MLKRILAITFTIALLISTLSVPGLAAPYKDTVITDGVTVIELEDFDTEDYQENGTNPDWGPKYDARPDEKVQTEACTNDKRKDAPKANYNLGWIDSGEWVQFTVTVAKGGLYNFSAWLASGAGSKGGVEIYYNDELVGYNTASKSTGWQDWDIYDIGEVSMSAGVQVITAVFPDGNVNIDAIVIECTEVYPPPPPPADMEATLGQIYQVVSLVAMDYIKPAKFKALADIPVDVDHPENLLAYAKAIGLLKNDDIINYKVRFKKAFDFEAPATRQEYAVIIDRFLSILKINGIEFVIPKSVSSSTSVAKGSGNGAGTSVNIGGGNTGANATIDFYKDYKDLSGYAQKAYASALAIGFLSVKKFEDTKTVKIITPKIDPNPIVIEKSFFLAPNDIVTFGELAEGLIVFYTLRPTEYTLRETFKPMLTLTSGGNVAIVEAPADDDAENTDEAED